MVAYDAAEVRTQASPGLQAGLTRVPPLPGAEAPWSPAGAVLKSQGCKPLAQRVLKDFLPCFVGYTDFSRASGRFP